MKRPVREVLLIIGDVGVGKSLGGLSIANAHPDKFFHYFVADRAIDKLYEHFDNPLENVIEYNIETFSDVRRYTQDIIAATKDNPQDHWVIVDTVGGVYKLVTDDFTMAAYGETAYQVAERRILDFKHKGRNAADEAQGNIQGFKSYEWSLIVASFYNEFLLPLVRFSRLNIYLIGHINPLVGMGQNGKYIRQLPPLLAESKSRFEQLEVVPDFNTKMLKMLDTIMIMSCDTEGIHRLYTMKETGTRKWVNEFVPFTNFWEDYTRLAINGR